MRTRSRWVAPLSAMVVVAFFASGAPSSAAAEGGDLREWASRAVSDQPQVANDAVAKLRMAGPDGLRALLDAYGETVRAGMTGGSTSADEATWQRARTAIDAVAAQRDAWASGLYWYTDWDAARAASKASGKPILSLRLLGALDTEFSCANSRFFRTALYANGEVSAALRERFILHWKSVRPVPRITIDFGDGRTIERTITGNSIHYLLDADGNVIDALPGLYGPQAFLRRLNEAAKVARAVRGIDPVARAQYLQGWHAGQATQDTVAWEQDIAEVTGRPVQRGAGVKGSAKFVAAAAPPPPAAKAARAAVGKTVVERPLVAAVAPQPAAVVVEADDGVWQQIAARHADEARLDAGSRALMATKLGAARRASLPDVVRNFEQAMAEDTVRNEYKFHRQIHAWLGAAAGSPDAALAGDVAALNERVYAELFLTPSSDPWLGLVPRDAYSALEEDGICDSGAKGR